MLGFVWRGRANSFAQAPHTDPQCLREAPAEEAHPENQENTDTLTLDEPWGCRAVWAGSAETCAIHLSTRKCLDPKARAKPPAEAAPRKQQQ